MDPLVTTEWLARHLGDVTIVDSSWFMPSLGRNARAEYLQAHIPRARYLDIDEVSDRANPAPHMLPTAEQFAASMETLGVGSGDRIVVYDNSPTRTAARGWFMLRHFGASDVAVLDGGFQKWTAEGRPTESGEPPPRTARFAAKPNDSEIVTKQQILSGEVMTPILDARGAGRFEGADPDPRPGVERGHIPGACNLPFAALYNDDGTFKPPDEIRRLFAAADVDPTRPFVATCGSGVTANSLIFAAHLLGNEATKLYDGSWSEWGSDPATPKVTGPAD
jgi:thiosulfate/3-mercaptopyruvate sulfurtransferase